MPDAVHPRSVLEIAAANLYDQSTLQALLRYTWTSETRGRAYTISLRDDRRYFAEILLASNADINRCVRIDPEDSDCWNYAPLFLDVEQKDLGFYAEPYRR